MLAKGRQRSDTMSERHEVPGTPDNDQPFGPDLRAFCDRHNIASRLRYRRNQGVAAQTLRGLDGERASSRVRDIDLLSKLGYRTPEEPEE